MPIEAAAPLPDIIDLRKRRREMGALWRVCGWGGGAAAALTAVAILSQTDNGSERLQLAVTQLTEPAPVLAADETAPPVVERVVERAVKNEAMTRRLSAELHALTADRDRLALRVAGLEHQLGDLTGSIKKQTGAASAPTAKPAFQTSAAVHASPPAVAIPRLEPLAMPAITETPAPLAPTPAPSVAEVPMPPTRIAAAPSIEPEPPPKPEYGIDLGSGLTLELLRLRWMAVKANYGPLLAGLHPVAAQDRRRGQAPYRLLAGPLPTMTAAAHLCARFYAVRAACHPARFSGENLAQR
jgi:hypothetical protein